MKHVEPHLGTHDSRVVNESLVCLDKLSRNAGADLVR